MSYGSKNDLCRAWSLKKGSLSSTPPIRLCYHLPDQELTTTRLCHSQNFLLTRVLVNLLRKGLGRSKPATLPCNKHKQHNLWGFYYIQAPWTAFCRIKMSTTSVREFGCLFLTSPVFNRKASDLDVKDHTALDDYSWMISNPTTQNRNLLLYKNIWCFTFNKSVDVKKAIHSLHSC